MRLSMRPTPRLAWLVVLLSTGWLLAPLTPYAIWVAAAADIVLLAFVLLDVGLLRDAAGIKARRDIAPLVSVLAACPVSITLDYRGRHPLLATVVDDPPESVEGEGEIASVWLEPGLTWSGHYSIRPLQRGRFVFGPLHIAYRTSIGLLQRVVRYQEVTTVAVYPVLHQLQPLQLRKAMQLFELTGTRRRPAANVAMEFESLRDYHPDDEPRRIDWKASARRERLIVRQYQEERSQYVLILLDCGRTMASQMVDSGGTPFSKLDLSVNAALTLAWTASNGGDRVGLMAFAEEVVGYQPPGKGRHQLGPVAHFLHTLQPRRVESDYRKAFAYLSGLWKRRALVVLFTDLADPETSAALLDSITLLSRHHMVLVVALSDHELAEIVASPPQTEGEMYEQAVARGLQRDRARGQAAMRARGVLSLDASPSMLSPSVLSRYMNLKKHGW